jgi:hypothetical protein
VLANFPEVHFYENVDALIYDDSPCINPAHSNLECPKNAGHHRADLCVMGTPCQPFSSLRDHNQINAQQHPGYDTTFIEAINLLATSMPFGVICEQVKGFLQPICKTDPSTTYLSTFVSKVQSLKGKDGKRLYTGTKVMCLNPSPWLDMSRSRFATQMTLALSLFSRHIINRTHYLLNQSSSFTLDLSCLHSSVDRRLGACYAAVVLCVHGYLYTTSKIAQWLLLRGTRLLGDDRHPNDEGSHI